MKKFLLVLSIVVVPVISAAQGFPPGSKALWDYNIVEFTQFAIDRFDVILDGITQAGVSITPFSSTTDLYTFLWPLPLDIRPGNHTIEVRACNAAGCSPPLALNFAILGTANKPSNLRIIPPS